MLIAFPHGVEIGDMRRQPMFYRASEMDTPQAIMLECFFTDTKSEGMHQLPKFYRVGDMHDCQCLMRFPFPSVKYIYNSMTSNKRGNLN